MTVPTNARPAATSHRVTTGRFPDVLGIGDPQGHLVRGGVDYFKPSSLPLAKRRIASLSRLRLVSARFADSIRRCSGDKRTASD